MENAGYLVVAVSVSVLTLAAYAWSLHARLAALDDETKLSSTSNNTSAVKPPTEPPSSDN